MTSPLPHDLVVCLDLNGETVEAGHASFRFRGSAMTTSFAYAPDYLALRQAYSFDPQWFLDIGPHTSEGLPPALADTAPDRWGRSLISRRIRAEAAAASQQARPITELDYLLGVSDVTRQGALRFRTPRGEEYLASATGVPKLVDLAELMAAADTVASDPNDDHATQQALKILLAAGSGTLGGARPKASIQDGDHLYVAKFPHAGDAWNVMAWEQTALDLAAAAGLPVPVRRLVTLNDRHVLLLRRFDRSDASGRLGYVSASTFTGGSSTAARDYLDLVAAIEDHSGDVDGDLEDLYRRIMFSLAINNTDDHMRNTAFLYTTNGWRLSPVYDVNPDPQIGRPRATSVFGHLARAPGLASLRGDPAYFGLSISSAEQIVEEVFAATSTWREVATRNGVTAEGLELFRPVFDWTPSLPLTQ